MTTLEKLTRYFELFPGVGARQAKRFAFHVLTMPESDRAEFTTLINNLHGSVQSCTSCRRYFTRTNSAATTCSICSDTNRDQSTILVVSHDADITAIERSSTYQGLYFVLGGLVPLLGEKETTAVRGNGLKAAVTSKAESGDLTEVIIGLPVNPDGENTGRYIEGLLRDIQKTHQFNISHLGRGLSTGSELEYADSDTIKNALRNRL